MKCFDYNKKFKKKCVKKECRYWIKSNTSQNCGLNIVKSQESKKITLQDIGDYFNVTRMRICQIEKIAIKKLKEKLT
jgi:YesN/AraC family two-component response regulator